MLTSAVWGSSTTKGRARNDRFTYFGCIRGGRPQGVGIKFDSSRAIELGSFEQGRLHGHGKRMFAPGNVFVGEFEHGVRNATGNFYDQKSARWMRQEQGRLGRVVTLRSKSSRLVLSKRANGTHSNSSRGLRDRLLWRRSGFRERAADRYDSVQSGACPRNCRTVQSVSFEFPRLQLCRGNGEGAGEMGQTRRQSSIDWPFTGRNCLELDAELPVPVGAFVSARQ